MTDANFSIRVDEAPSHNMYAWVIVEQRGATEPVEVAASLKTYAQPSEAMRAAEHILGVLAPMRMYEH